ncbi:Hypothetical protein R9X50_00028300 [Acrodontium crateriforme]|uniref:Uncharacterized protein n=1 Tax=Acrodontium crateriforme TaxID=150365 RepID=A0AAQ3LWZ1_9PEZI|nr:Hypothetical protein R9X50_00028300 [Acrodontium crateriforme]
MASLANTARLSARLASRNVARCAPARSFRMSARERAAQNFTMPALSPTMTEGNIAAWRVKEGDAYSAGDVLLEIETDKATMDVEAQDDGVMFKVLVQDGSKGVKVGERIAVIAEEGDDLSSLELPADNSGAKSATQEKRMEAVEQKERSSSQEKSLSPEESKKSTPSSASQGGKAQKQTKPLYPSVEHLLHANGLTKDDADAIPASGPKGRLLKGDVLAYLGQISKDAPANATARLNKLSHLDLSNIQIAKPTPAPEAAKAAATAQPELPQETEFAVPISLAAVIATQKRIQDSLGIFLPLSTFIARASELANEDLPIGKSQKPTADDLFNSVLGLDTVARSSRGQYVPEITGLGPVSYSRPSNKKADIIDLLAPKQKKAAPIVSAESVGISSGDNVLSVMAKSGDEARATEYLERMKLALEKEPGRLVI